MLVSGLATTASAVTRTITLSYTSGVNTINTNSLILDQGQSLTLTAVYQVASNSWSWTNPHNAIAGLTFAKSSSFGFCGNGFQSNSNCQITIATSSSANGVGTNTIEAQDGANSGTNTILVTVHPSLTTLSLTPSPTAPSSQTVGNTLLFAASWSGGTSTYSANYIISNSITGHIITSQKYTGISGTSNTFSYTVSSSLVGNTIRANVIIADSAATPASASSVNTGTFTIIPVYTSPSTPTIIASRSLPATLDMGQTIKFTSSVSGGSSPYSYNFLISNSITNAIVGTSGAQSTNSFTYTTAATGNFYANVIVTDSHPTTVNSTYTNQFTVNPPITVTVSVPDPTINAGDNEIITASVTGGTAPYSYQWKLNGVATGTNSNTLLFKCHRRRRGLRTVDDVDSVPEFRLSAAGGGQRERLGASHFLLFSPDTGDRGLYARGCLRAVSAGAVAAVLFPPVSEREQPSIEELESQTTNLLSFRPIERAIFDEQVAFNLLSGYGGDSKPSMADVRKGIVRDVTNYLAGCAPRRPSSFSRPPYFMGML